MNPGEGVDVEQDVCRVVDQGASCKARTNPNPNPKTQQKIPQKSHHVREKNIDDDANNEKKGAASAQSAKNVHVEQLDWQIKIMLDYFDTLDLVRWRGINASGIAVRGGVTWIVWMGGEARATGCRRSLRVSKANKQIMGMMTTSNVRIGGGMSRRVWWKEGVRTEYSTEQYFPKADDPKKKSKNQPMSQTKCNRGGENQRNTPLNLL